MPETWYKVDNVAKVFLASINRRDPRVFRVSCTLNEDVDPDCLNQALEQTARENPQFRSRCTVGCSGIILNPPT